ncbi:MAG: metal-dependent transcriptional regulator [Clostridiaceae bacterium]|nr:metal-dependent transcriptional regulator [Clostridiaceae bacterium]
MALRYSGENYLKAILLLHQKQCEVREIDIAERLNFSKPSVSHMIKNLMEQGYVTVQENNVCLTEKGFEAANGVYDRFSVIQIFLIQVLGIPPEIARRDAGAMEHVVSNETFEALQKLVKQNGGVTADDLIPYQTLDKR